MSKKKAAGKTRQQKRTAGKRLGLKVADGERVDSGMILVRQRGTKYHPGQNVRVGRDHTLFAEIPGAVKFGTKLGRRVVSVT